MPDTVRLETQSIHLYCGLFGVRDLWKPAAYNLQVVGLELTPVIVQFIGGLVGLPS